jgi:hypothetical protein
MRHKRADMVSAEAVNVANSHIVGLASSGAAPTTYRRVGDLLEAKGVCAEVRFPQDIGAMTDLLALVVDKHWHKPGDPLITAVVVRADTDRPGNGFYGLAQTKGLLPDGRGASDVEKERVWSEQLALARGHDCEKAGCEPISDLGRSQP